MSRFIRSAGFVLLFALAASCSKGSGGDNDGQPPAPPSPPTPVTVDLDVDANRNGTVENPADDTGEDGWTASLGAVYYWNIDDDDNNNNRTAPVLGEDHLDTSANGTADAADLARIVVRQMAAAPAAGTMTFTVSTEARGRIRVYWNNSGSWMQIYNSGATFTVPISAAIAGNVELGIESRERVTPTWDGRVTITLDVRNGSGSLLGSDAVLLRSAPFLMATNLWRAEQLSVVDMGSSNSAFRSALSSVCGTAGVTYVQAPGSSYSFDQWIQDSHEIGIVYLPSSTSARRRVDQVLQCARWRPIDAWSEDILFAPDFDFARRFSTNQSSHNYGGNLEVTGPLASYPWGRILIGGGTSAPIGGGAPVTSRLVQAYRDYFNALDIQGPWLEVSTEWLTVGHVDEHTMVVPAPANARGWAILLASPDLARANLTTVAGNGGGNLNVFAGRNGWQTTVNSILNNTALMAYNDEVQGRMDAIRAQYQSQLGLAASEIIDVPVLFEDSGFGGAVAYNPGVVNLIVLPTTGSTTYLVIPDPEGPDQPTDVWQAETTARIQALFNGANPVSITYADIFFSYHVNLGEAHCGVNFVRTPPAENWWDD